MTREQPATTQENLKRVGSVCDTTPRGCTPSPIQCPPTWPHGTKAHPKSRAPNPNGPCVQGGECASLVGSGTFEKNKVLPGFQQLDGALRHGIVGQAMAVLACGVVQMHDKFLFEGAFNF